MGQFYKPSSYKRFKRFLKKTKKFTFRNDGPHFVATYTEDESIVLAIPRSKDISNGVTEKLCEALVGIGFTEDEVKKGILK